MGFKKMDKSLNFAQMKSASLLLNRNFIGQADFVLANSLKHNRSLAIMENIDKAIN